MNIKMSKDDNLPIVMLLQSKPQAVAVINGSGEYPDIYGIVQLYGTQNGTVVYAQVMGLPDDNAPCGNRFFGFHIHSGTSCTGNADDPFASALKHYDTQNCEHPSHSGDLPPLYANNGNALSVFLTNRFTVDEVLGRTIIIHDKPDDLTTQPSGNSGKKIACGVIRSVAR